MSVHGLPSKGIAEEPSIVTRPASRSEHEQISNYTEPWERNNKMYVAIIEPRALESQCLSQCISKAKIDMEMLAFRSLDEWRQKQNAVPEVSAILLSVGCKKVSEAPIVDELKQLASNLLVPVIVLSDTDDLAQILKALECGAKGYIPTSVSLDVLVEAILLSLAGGIFVPVSSVLAMGEVLENNTPAPRPLSAIFTSRQAEVADALRRGKANKIIAYELNLRESTVKVHIRNIMKKMKATNRTEVAYKINDLFRLEETRGRAGP